MSLALGASCLGVTRAVAASALGKTADSPGSGAQPDPVQSFNRWKKKYSHRQKKKKQLRKQLKKPKWQVGHEGISRLMQNYEKINVNEITRFSYRLVTEIQKQTTGLALQGKDVLGAAKTGSGKTLAFLVQVLEALYRLQRTSTDGLGVLIISPMRKLAYQTFAVLQKVGKNHGFSAGLIIGAKNLKHEAERINNINILVCTPGQLLQHMDETVSFHATDLQMLVLDEVDRILDMGFADTENLTKKRQTLLFSATQTKSVKDLARLSLKNAEYVWVHGKAKYSTPATLEQNYIVVCEQQQKISSLYFFPVAKRSNICTECFARYVLAFLSLPSTVDKWKSIMSLSITELRYSLLPGGRISWVLIVLRMPTHIFTEQVELPAIVQQLLQKKVPVKEIKINPEKLIDVQKKLESVLAQDHDLKETAQRCFVSYTRLIYLMKDKEVFDVSYLYLNMPSLGLAVAPCIRFLQKVQKQPIKELVMSQADEVIEPMAPSLTDDKVEEFRGFFNEKMSILLKGGKRLKGAEHRLANNTSDEEQEEEEDDEEEMEEKLAKAKGSQAPSLPNTSEAQKIKEVPMQFLDRDEEEEDADFLKEKTLQKKEPSKSSIKKKSDQSCRSKKSNDENFKVNKKITGTDEGELVQQWPQMQKSAIKDAEEDDDTGGINLDKAKGRLQEEDRFDKEEYRKKIKAKHQEERLKERKARREASKRQVKAKDKEEAFLDWSDDDDDDGFDPSTLPDPDNEDMENEISDTKKKQGMKKRKNSEVVDMGPTSRNRKKAKWDTLEPLDTGLSLAEDEELVLHLLRSQS
uniref:ATP-dependent RNA helicase n=1 Tax=Rhinopithecus bieti TaxID=61621 RepID=A0A2K6M1G1_RHIBE